MKDATAEIALSATKSGQILQEPNSDLTVTVACLINNRNVEARSGGAEGQGTLIPT